MGKFTIFLNYTHEKYLINKYYAPYMVKTFDMTHIRGKKKREQFVI